MVFYQGCLAMKPGYYDYFRRGANDVLKRIKQIRLEC
jgi:hypothetical protein